MQAYDVPKLAGWVLTLRDTIRAANPGDLVRVADTEMTKYAVFGLEVRGLNVRDRKKGVVVELDGSLPVAPAYRAYRARVDLPRTADFPYFNKTTGAGEAKPRDCDGRPVQSPSAVGQFTMSKTETMSTTYPSKWVETWVCAEYGISVDGDLVWFPTVGKNT